MRPRTTMSIAAAAVQQCGPKELAVVEELINDYDFQQRTAAAVGLPVDWLFPHPAKKP